MESYRCCSKCGRAEYCTYIEGTNHIWHCNDCYHGRPKPPTMFDLKAMINSLEQEYMALKRQKHALERQLTEAHQETERLRAELARVRGPAPEAAAAAPQ